MQGGHHHDQRLASSSGLDVALRGSTSPHRRDDRREVPG
jgi:hypothetical protein